MRATLATAILATLALLGPARTSAANDIFYVIFFGSEDDPKHLKYSHTWATFVRATGEGCDPSAYAVTSHTISWQPRTLDVVVFRHSPEPGVNLGLDETMQLVMQQGQTVTAWGPYRIGPEIYNRSIEIYNQLVSGQKSYRAIDGPFNNEISDCIHAVGDIDPDFGRTRYSLDRIGKSASAFIAKQIVERSQYDHSQLDNRWLYARLGLNQYPIEYVSSQGPTRVREFEIRAIRSRLRRLSPWVD